MVCVGFLQIHQHGNFVRWLARQIDLANCPGMHAGNAYFRARIEAYHRGELCLQAIGAAEEVLLAPDYKDPRRKNQQRGDDKYSESRRP